MARKRTEKTTMPATTAETVKHVRLELPEDFHSRIKRQADRYGLSLTAYIRLATTERVERDERSEGDD
jgi:hypothetical protein